MPFFLSMLRGINVSGQKKIKMADLKVLYEDLGFTKVQTYIQSGNVVFQTRSKSESAIAKKIAKQIKVVYDFDVEIFIVTKEKLKQVIDNTPYPITSEADTKKICFTFLKDQPNSALVQSLNEYQDKIDEFSITPELVYICCHSSFGTTKLNNNFFERKLKVSATSRNWRTVQKLFSLLAHP